MGTVAWRTLACAAFITVASVALAQSGSEKWPTRPVRLVHGFISGGSVDITARLLAGHMTDALGQQVIVDGRPGAGGTTGASIVSRSTPDGYTLFLMASGHATSPALYRSLPYHPVRDFTMISMVASNPMVVLATPTFPPRTVQELVQAAKGEPGKINFGTGGVGTGMHLAAVLFQARAGIRMNHVPYKGGNAGPVALLAGEIPVLFTTAAGVINHVEAGRIRALAVTTKKRFVLWPNVPTIAETVVPEFDVLAWYAVAAPANLPAPLTSQLNGVVRETLKRSEVIEKLLALGAETRPSTPQEAQAFLASEVARWTKVIRDEKIPPQD
ncbi:MAG TPA: tripartite tricarboxylate transporter substrate binding protein [Burkholderiales bacterium]|nr:tripartite tricarboxylate transporter substrate binding protein [Burkholderiales bacterium]